MVSAEREMPLENEESVGCSAEEIELIARAGVARPYRGEVRIWSDDGFVTRIHLCDRRIAWVHCNRNREHLGDVLRRRASVSSWSLRRAMDHASRTGTNLGESLAALQILPLPRLRALLQEHIQSHIDAALELREPLRAQFVPGAHRYHSALVFEVDDFAWDSARVSTRRAQTDVELLVERCREVAETIAGGLSFAIVDVEESMIVAHAARDPARQSTHADAFELLLADVMAPLRAAIGGADLDEVGLQFGNVGVIMRASDDGRFGYVLVVDASCTMGAAGAHLRLATEQFDGASPNDAESPIPTARDQPRKQDHG